jgi:hypothetical protein
MTEWTDEKRAEQRVRMKAVWTPEKRAAHSERMTKINAEKARKKQEATMKPQTKADVVPTPSGDHNYNDAPHKIQLINNERNVITYEHGLASVENMATDAYEWLIACFDSRTNRFGIEFELVGDSWSFTLHGNNIEVVE